MSMVNPPTRSKMMFAALLLTTLAFIAIVAAYVGEWWTVHIEYSKDFPNDLETDRGFRILKVYWMTFGFLLLSLGALSWLPGLLLYVLAGFGRYAPFMNGPGRWCTVLNLILGSYVFLLFLRGLFSS